MEQKDSRQELQNLLMEAEGGKRQLEGIREEMQMLEITLNDINSSIEALDSLKTSVKGSEILVPIGAASFIKAELKDNEKVIVGIGAGISVEKSVEEAKTQLEARKKDMQSLTEKLDKRAAELTSRLIEIDEKSRAMVSELQRREGGGPILPDGV